MADRVINVHTARQAGIEYCKTEGSDHYKGGDIETADLMMAKGIFEDFAIGSILKYADRFKKTRNLNDLKKVADYAHILCGEKILRGRADDETLE